MHLLAWHSEDHRHYYWSQDFSVKPTEQFRSNQQFSAVRITSLPGYERPLLVEAEEEEEELVPSCQLLQSPGSQQRLEYQPLSPQWCRGLFLMARLLFLQAPRFLPSSLPPALQSLKEKETKLVWKRKIFSMQHVGKHLCAVYVTIRDWWQNRCFYKFEQHKKVTLFHCFTSSRPEQPENR